tara:strand:- start:1258 stop:1527 length:270 start_codon:yes stop_codon:yes gene_type:complete
MCNNALYNLDYAINKWINRTNILKKEMNEMTYELKITNSDAGDHEDVSITKCKNKDEIIRLLAGYITERFSDEVLIDGKNAEDFKKWWN